MKFSVSFHKKQILPTAIVIFLVFYIGVNYLQPSILYDEYGNIRPFGLGYTNTTVIPVWMFAIFLGVLSYLTSVVFFNTFTFRRFYG